MVGLHTIRGISLSLLMSFGLQIASSHAHDGGAIVLLPIILAEEMGKEIYKLNATNFKLKKYDAKVVIAYTHEKNILNRAVAFKKANSLYQFFKATNIDEARSACAATYTGRLASPTEVLKLYKIQSVFTDLNALLTTQDEPDYVKGFYDGSDDYFKINVDTQKVETYQRNSSEASPVICIQDYEKVRQKRKEERGDKFDEVVDEVIDIIKNPDQE